MKIVIRWNNITDNNAGHRTSTIETEKDKTSASLIIGWLTAGGRNPETVIIHDINVNSFTQRLAGSHSALNLTPEQRTARAKKAVEARIEKYNQNRLTKQ